MHVDKLPEEASIRLLIQLIVFACARNANVTWKRQDKVLKLLPISFMLINDNISHGE